MQPWELLSEDEPIKIGYRKVQRRMFRVPDGSEKEFHVKVEGRTVCVVPFTKDGRVILAKQFRPGPMQFAHELPGGWVDPSEDVMEAGKRELLEETGYAAGSMEPLGAYLRCAYSTAETFIFLARDCERVSEPDLDPAEFVDVGTHSMDEFVSIVHGGRMTDVAGALLALRKLGV